MWGFRFKAHGLRKAPATLNCKGSKGSCLPVYVTITKKLGGFSRLALGLRDLGIRVPDVRHSFLSWVLSSGLKLQG